MSDFNTRFYLNILMDAGTAEKVAEAFAGRINILPKEQQRLIADHVELEIVSELSQVPVRSVKDLPGIEQVQATSSVIGNIARIKGDEANPFVQRYVEGLTKMSDADYNSLDAHYQLLRAASGLAPEKGAEAKSGPTANPFRAEAKPAPAQKFNELAALKEKVSDLEERLAKLEKKGAKPSPQCKGPGH